MHTFFFFSHCMSQRHFYKMGNLEFSSQIKFYLLVFSASIASTQKVAVVTGANKGIGFAIVKGLCEKFDGDVYLTSRDEGRGLAAVKKLNELGYKPKFHLLDVTVPESVMKLRDHLTSHYGGIDALVNNAAIAFKRNATDPFEIQARVTLRVNYFALRDVCNILFSILKSFARVVNVSSYVGHLSKIPGKHLRDILASPDLTEERLDTLMTSFIEAAKNGTHIQQGWPETAYTVSKVGVSALTRVQQRQILRDSSRPNILINHVEPGYVDTDMTSHKGTLTIDQGAEAPIYLALLPENCTSPRGDYVSHTKKIVDWVNGPLQ